MKQISFLNQELEVSYERLDKLSDPLQKLDEAIDFSGLEKIMDGIKFEQDYNKSKKGKGGRKPLCGLMMAKVMLLQSLYNLSDDAAEYQINDRLSFKRFIGLDFAKKAPDAKTIWLWRERIKHGELDQKIFAWFESELAVRGYAAKKGQIIDASFVTTHKPSNKHKKQLKEETSLTKRQSEQIDTDASFTKKGKTTHHGYKNHINIDNEHKFIRRQTTSTASVHDSQTYEELAQNLPKGSSSEDAKVWADSAYRSEKIEEITKDKGLISHIHERNYRGKKLSDEQKAQNKNRSKIRARVEHVFGHMATSMGGLMIHTIGIARAKVKVTFKNLAYNMQRFAMLERHKKLGV